MGRRRYTKAQVWEAAIIITLVLIFLYRLALVYDYVPKQYQPSAFLYDAYTEFKISLAAKSGSPSFGGKLASSALDKMLAIEAYVKRQQEYYRISQEASERCQENMIFRYFMFMGDEKNSNCSPQNMRLNEAVKEINNSSQNVPADSSAPNSTSQPADQSAATQAAPLPATTPTP